MITRILNTFVIVKAIVIKTVIIFNEKAYGNISFF